jgi:hypothetical protein
MKQLIETLETLRLRNIGFRSLTEALDTTTKPDPRTHPSGAGCRKAGGTHGRASGQIDRRRS